MQALVYTGTMVKMALEAKNINRSSDTRLSRDVSHVFVCVRNSHTDFSRQRTVKRLHVEQNFDPHKENSASLANLAEHAVRFLKRSMFSSFTNVFKNLCRNSDS